MGLPGLRISRSIARWFFVARNFAALSARDFDGITLMLQFWLTRKCCNAQPLAPVKYTRPTAFEPSGNLCIREFSQKGILRHLFGGVGNTETPALQEDTLVGLPVRLAISLSGSFPSHANVSAVHRRRG
jgi:hypothetical protein